MGLTQVEVEDFGYNTGDAWETFEGYLALYLHYLLPIYSLTCLLYAGFGPRIYYRPAQSLCRIQFSHRASLHEFSTCCPVLYPTAQNPKPLILNRYLLEWEPAVGFPHFGPLDYDPSKVLDTPRRNQAQESSAFLRRVSWRTCDVFQNG
eukprot:3941028-Rhodomonas_salina.2